MKTKSSSFPHDLRTFSFTSEVNLGITLTKWSRKCVSRALFARDHGLRRRERLRRDIAARERLNWDHGFTPHPMLRSSERGFQTTRERNEPQCPDREVVGEGFTRGARSGSALVATLLVIGSLGLIVAGIARFTTIEVRTSGALEDAALAFHAAEAGIEDGLLRWRFDRTSELPIADMHDEVIRGTRVNLSQGSYQANVDLTAPPSAGPDAVYDLRMWYKTRQVGDPANLLESSYPYRLGKDATLEVDVSDLNDRFLTFTYHVPDEATYTARIETRVVTELPDGSLTELCCKTFSEASSGRAIRIFLPEAAIGRSHRIRIKPYLFDATTGTAPAPAASFIRYALQPELTSSFVDSGITIIESTGYVGAARRTLVAKIDRSSGTILGVYDFALFAGQGSVSGP